MKHDKNWLEKNFYCDSHDGKASFDDASEFAKDYAEHMLFQYEEQAADSCNKIATLSSRIAELEKSAARYHEYVIGPQLITRVSDC